MKKNVVLALIFLSSICASAQSAMPPVDGYWRYTVPNRETNFFLWQQSGETLTGTRLEWKNVLTGTLVGNKVHLGSSPLRIGFRCQSLHLLENPGR